MIVCYTSNSFFYSTIRRNVLCPEFARYSTRFTRTCDPVGISRCGTTKAEYNMPCPLPGLIMTLPDSELPTRCTSPMVEKLSPADKSGLKSLTRISVSMAFISSSKLRRSAHPTDATHSKDKINMPDFFIGSPIYGICAPRDACQMAYSKLLILYYHI